MKDPNVEIKIVQNGVVVQDKTNKREFTLTSKRTASSWRELGPVADATVSELGSFGGGVVVR